MEPPPPPSALSFLPIDLVLEIASRSDPVTLVRCAAACKALRRHVTGGRLHLRLRRHAADGRFVPTLLAAFLYQRRDREDPLTAVGQPLGLLRRGDEEGVVTRAVPLLPVQVLGPLRVLPAHGGLVGLRTGSGDPDEPVHGPWPGYVGVCNRILDFFPSPPGIPARSYALLTEDCDAIACRFRLLGASLSPSSELGNCYLLRTQAYSSDTYAWGDVTETLLPTTSEPATGRRVRASMPSRPRRRGPLALQLGAVRSFVLAFSEERSSAATVTAIHGVERLRQRKPEELLLLSSADGRVSLLVAEEQLKISLWTAVPPDDDPGSAGTSCWTRTAVMIGNGKVRL